MQNFNNEWFVRLTRSDLTWTNLDKALTTPNLAPTAPDVPRWQFDGALPNDTTSPVC